MSSIKLPRLIRVSFTFFLTSLVFLQGHTAMAAPETDFWDPQNDGAWFSAARSSESADLPSDSGKLSDKLGGNFAIRTAPSETNRPPLSKLTRQTTSVPEPGDENWATGFEWPGVNDAVTALASDRHGNLYVAGSFTEAGGVQAAHVARWDGTTWHALGTGTDHLVFALAVDDNGVLYAGGEFETAGGVSARHVAKWDGRAWQALGDGFMTDVYALALDSTDNLYVGGFFSVALWDGRTWRQIGDFPDGAVLGLVTDPMGGVYAGGAFSTAGDTPANNIARWDGTSWHALGSGINCTTYYCSSLALALDRYGMLYVGGHFSGAGGVNVNNIARWDGVAWHALGSGIGGFDQAGVRSLIVDGDQIFVGGTFTEAGNVSATNVAEWDGSTWYPLAHGVGLAEYPSTYGLALSSGMLYAGGAFTTADGINVSNIARWDNSAWRPLNLSQGIYGGQATNISIAVKSDVPVFASGTMIFSQRPWVNWWAYRENSVWHMEEIGSGYISTLAIDNSGDVLAGGNFSTLGGVEAHNVARWDGAIWSSLGLGLNGSVQALAIDKHDNLYAGGAFTTAGAVDAIHVARWDGTQWHPLGSGISSEVAALAVDSNGNLYAGTDNYPDSNVYRWDGNNWTSLGTGITGGGVTALATDDRGMVYAGGNFLFADGDFAWHVAGWDGTHWHGLGDGVDQPVSALVVDSGGNLFVCGRFEHAGGISARGIARWDGAIWHGLGSGNSGCSDLAKNSQGNVFTGGEFDRAGGKISLSIARWTAAEGQDIQGLATYSFYSGNLPVKIDVAVLGSLSRITIQRHDRSYPDPLPAFQTGYHWEIRGLDANEQPASGYEVSLTIPTTFAPDNNDQLCRRTDFTWDCANISFGPESITRTNITELSEWTTMRHFSYTYFWPLANAQ